MAEKILVVDDDPDIVKFIEVTLTRAGFDVGVAFDGREALDKVSDWRPDLVLLDIMLPTIDGFEVAHDLRRRARLTGMAIIIVSARGLPEDRLRGLSIGVDDYIVKPFEPDILLARVRAALRRLHDMRSLSPLTGLPGTVLIEEEIRRAIQRDDHFALLYVDLDNFKALNDTKGWDVGNRVILVAARVIDEAVTQFAGHGGFVGHIGGDDFVALLPAEVAEQAATWVCKRFDEEVEAFYEADERDRGYVEATDRRGQPVRYPLVTISVGIATTAVRSFSEFGDVVSIATEMKQAAKRSEGSCYAVDRRRAS
ncbi:MAG TPA: response regulator [Actinomycetota bacterium]|nr:response regulator [Actinomycetota bacterium]